VFVFSNVSIFISQTSQKIYKKSVVLKVEETGKQIRKSVVVVLYPKKEKITEVSRDIEDNNKTKKKSFFLSDSLCWPGVDDNINGYIKDLERKTSQAGFVFLFGACTYYLRLDYIILCVTSVTSHVDQLISDTTGSQSRFNHVRRRANEGVNL
jgi:hypothetical protein